MKASKNEKKSQQDLEPNHTHFLLLDDGTYYKYDTGDYRTRFVLEASHYQQKDGNYLYLFFSFVILCYLFFSLSSYCDYSC
jgi:hypothetical protein